MTNFATDIKKINKDYCNSLFAVYMKSCWGIVVGFNTIPLYIIRMKKQLADYQANYDCQKVLCLKSKTQSLFINKVAVPVVAGECVLNPPLSAAECKENWNFNTNQLIIPTFN